MKPVFGKMHEFCSSAPSASSSSVASPLCSPGQQGHQGITKSKLNEMSLQALNSQFWLNFKSIGHEIADLALQDGYRLRVKSKDAKRAVVFCQRSGLYQTVGQQRTTKTLKCGCGFKIDLRKSGRTCNACSDVLQKRLIHRADHGSWSISRSSLIHNHAPLSSTEANLITSYRGLSTLIWSDLRRGVEEGLSARALIERVRELHPQARSVTELVFKNSIQKVKRESAAAMMSPEETETETSDSD